MSMRKVLILIAIAWLIAITVVHAWLNLHSFDAKRGTGGPSKFGVGFIPVTCHLTCPVTDFINKSMEGESFFDPMRFNGFPELKETFLGKPQVMPATFILAPMAMALREQGVPIKIVYLGHRDGTAMMVHKDSKIFRIEDLKGKTIAVPNRFANQRLLIFKALRERGMSIQDVNLIEMPPPDMCGALFTCSGRDYFRRAVHGSNRARWIWAGSLSDQRCLAEFYFMCVGRE